MICKSRSLYSVQILLRFLVKCINGETIFQLIVSDTHCQMCVDLVHRSFMASKYLCDTVSNSPTKVPFWLNYMLLYSYGNSLHEHLHSLHKHRNSFELHYVNKSVYLRKRYSHVFCKQVDECLTVHLVSNCSAVTTVRRIGHILNILDEQQLNFVAMFNISVVLMQWSPDGAKKGKPSVFSWRLFC